MKFRNELHRSPAWTQDVTADNSNKSFTVPAGHYWILQSIYAEIAATATVGSRLLAAIITNGTNPVYRSKATAAIAASAKGSLLVTNAGGASDTTVRPALDGSAQTVCLNAYDLPKDLILPAGYVINVKDTAGIAATADDMNVVLHYIDVTLA